MKKFMPSLVALALAAGVHSQAADAPAPPPPGGTAKRSGAAGKFNDATEHHPVLGLVKQVEEKGKVTKAEFIASNTQRLEQIFSKIDKNGDGVVDKSEIAEIEQKMKELKEKMQERGGSSAGPRKRPGA